MDIYIDTSNMIDKSRATALLETSFYGTPLAGTPETEDEYSTGILVTDEQFAAAADFLPDHDERLTAGDAVLKRYSIDGAEVFILETPYEHGLFLADAGTPAEQIVGSFERGDLDYYQHMASWGLDATPDAAADGAKNVRVWVHPHYYAGTIGAPLPHYAMGDDGEQLIFDDTEAAQTWIDQQEDGVYVLGNGEAGRPDYTICN